MDFGVFLELLQGCLVFRNKANRRCEKEIDKGQVFKALLRLNRKMKKISRKINVTKKTNCIVSPLSFRFLTAIKLARSNSGPANDKIVLLCHVLTFEYYLALVN